MIRLSRAPARGAVKISPREKAWKVLRMIKNTIVVQEQNPCETERRTIYNPYSKKYEIRRPIHRKNKKEELKMVMKCKDDERDLLWIGDKMSEERQKGDIRIWMQNWNGVEKKMSILCVTNYLKLQIIILITFLS